MSTFNLPDLGEGLPDAEVSEWHVKVGDTVKTDQPLVSMETAKAVVEVPSPQDRVIQTLHGEKGDIIKTGSALVTFDAGASAEEDAGTVVGNIKSSGETIEDDFIIGSAQSTATTRPRATPKVRAQARKLGIDLASITGTGNGGMITLTDLEAAAHPLQPGFEPIKGVRRHMIQTMSQSHQEVVPVAIFDDVSIAGWDDQQDITVRLIQAICHAAKEEPALNAWYDGHNAARKLFDKVQLGMATDTPDGLFVPVIRDACCLDAQGLRAKINEFKQTVSDRSVASEDLSGGTITLSNFGKFAGRYATPIIVPPTVAILAVGRLNEKRLPLSLSFDHRAVTGGEATRFLGAVMESLA